MTKKSNLRLDRQKTGIPAQENIASLRVDNETKKLVFTTKDMIINQIHRDGPKICRTFDTYTKPDVQDCSSLFGVIQGMVIYHLPRIDDMGFKATSARLLASASSIYIASIEVARHGFRRQYGILARSLIETLATIVCLAIRPTALDEFHQGNLNSAKCIGWAKPVLHAIGDYYGMLSNEFVHVGRTQSHFEPTSPYKDDDEALPFIVNSLRANVWMMYVVAELIYHDELPKCRYWDIKGEGEVQYNPSDEERSWMTSFLGPRDLIAKAR